MAKIAISLPDEVFHSVEKERKESGISRSEFFRRAVEEHLRRDRERADIERYIKGYQQFPETEEEMAWVESTIHYAFDDAPWEEGSNQ